MTEFRKTYLSLGAGVQSSTMALMASKGLITPMPNAAIFADTGDEPESVYRWLNYLEGLLAFPVVRVSKGSLSSETTRIRRSGKSGRLYIGMYIPAFVTRVENGMTLAKRVGMMGRRCTGVFKIDPIVKYMRSDALVKRGSKDKIVSQWIGISVDEASRMKDAKTPWIENRWPLVELGFSRDDCLAWMRANTYPEPPRSACFYCPFHSDEQWRRMKEEEPNEFARAVAYERELRAAIASQEVMKGDAFLHSECIPLDEIKFADRPSHSQRSLFENECEGMCGV